MKTSLDRLGHLRGNPEALAGERAHPEAACLPMWRGKHLVEGDPLRAAWLPLAGADLPEPVVFLGRDATDRPRFAADLSALEAPPSPPGTRYVDLLRSGLAMEAAELEVLFYARGILQWHAAARACERCGAAGLVVSQGGFKRSCAHCEAVVFPRSDPAVMVLVTHGDRALLARQPGFPKGMYSALAGFVEPGESLEQCVHRETREEVGLDVDALRYVGSQPWPFPQSLMVGFRAEASSSDFVLDPGELEAARWVTRDELRAPVGFFYPPPISLAHRLVRAFMEEG